jgi:hypothetical protein
MYGYNNYYLSLAAKEKKGEYSYDKGGGSYIGTPGWYTIVGHHHCNKGTAGCVCTDPNKCFKTGNPPSSSSECRPDLDRYGAKPASLCRHVGAGGGIGGGGGGHGKFNPVMLGLFAVPVLLLLLVLAYH